MVPRVPFDETFLGVSDLSAALLDSCTTSRLRALRVDDEKCDSCAVSRVESLGTNGEVAEKRLGSEGPQDAADLLTSLTDSTASAASKIAVPLSFEHSSSSDDVSNVV